MKRPFLFTMFFLVICMLTDVIFAETAPVFPVQEGVFIKEWLVCGTFPNPLKEGVVEFRHDETTLGFYIDYLAKAGGENNITPEEGMSIDPGDGITRVWKKYTSPEDYINFNNIFEDNQGGKVAYAFCYLKSDMDKEVILGIGSNDGVRVWLNGERIWDNHCPRGAMIDDDCFEVSLKSGLNPLLIKVDQGFGNWGFYARVVNKEEVLKKLKDLPDLRADITYVLENNSLRAWMARHSKYRLLDPPIQYTLQLLNANGESVQKNSANLGQSVTFSLEGLPEGPYRLEGKFSLPDGTTFEKQSFYYHGQPTVIINFGQVNDDIKPRQIELLYDSRQRTLKDEAILKSSQYTPVLEPVSGGIQELDSGKYAVLRTDLSPIWIRVLLPSPGLGYQWYMLKDEGYRFETKEIQEINALEQIEKNLRNRYSNALESGTFPFSEWLFQSYSQRLMLTPVHQVKGEISPEERLRRIQRLSSLKAKVADKETATVWFAPSIEKVGKNEPTPDCSLEYLPLDIAKNEYEAFQVVITPKSPISSIKVNVTDGKTQDGYTLPAGQFKIFEVDYVPITVVSDYYGELTDYPDPIVPVQDYVKGRTDGNIVLWVRLYVGKGQPPGIYEGSLQLKSNELNLEIPYKVNVVNYTLPVDTSTETAYGVSPGYSWHGPLNDEQKREVFDLYMKTCMEYRISPYTPHAYGPITWKFEGTPPEAIVDFTEFDKAMEKYLNQYHFNAFNVGGLPNELNGAPRYSEEYNRLFASIYQQVQEHLREKGWLHKAYWYWVDEPAPADYASVKQGMELLYKACPDIRRLLTCNQEPAPAPYFWDVVNLWVPIFNMYDETRARWRQELGETIWWYVCTAPRAPYANNFVDHPAINHRIRYWQLDKYNLEGDLFWSITYWAQNPWEEAMSIGDGGQRWGNGDGRLLYPPRKQPSSEPLIEPPVPSIRLECIRDGLEDREYLLVLERADARKAPIGLMARKVRAEALNYLTPSLKVYEQNPVMFYYYRAKVMNLVARIAQGGS
ncbi:MAG TPA: DUF4091 domain-containing protein [Candidatus Hydrogenedens sp.]|nr:DUF4091 domain-containing protein [Candidatus Hydrogenedens sp.]HOL19745.1 DUF4091 domain-containing protein [Candidatus Hydrogenedens sp.]HPP59017.1 DUF4091 domain-containing protein [Candidatus Hydrogenedens sp.]